MIGCEGVTLCHIARPAQPQVTLQSHRQWSGAECEHIYVMSHIIVMPFVFTVCYFVKISALTCCRYYFNRTKIFQTDVPDCEDELPQHS